MPKKRIAAIYARTSVERTESRGLGIKKPSIDEQIDAARELIKRQGDLIYAKEHEYIDRDVSGKDYPPCWLKRNMGTSNRPRRKKERTALSHLIEAIEKGEVQAVIVRRLDRLSRNIKLTIKILELFTQKQIRVLATHESLPSDDSATGRFALQVLIAANQMELEKIQENILRSKQYAKKQGKKLGPIWLCGYKNGKERGTIIRDPKGAVIVKEVFDKYINGDSISEIVRHCNKEHPSDHPAIGKQWYNSTIKRMLSNSHYIGQTDSFTDDGKRTGDAVDSALYEPIISKSQFRSVQQQLKSRRNAKHGQRIAKHLLSGFLHCAHCGARLVIYSRFTKKSSQRIGFEFKCIGKHDRPKAFTMRESLWDEWASLFLDVRVAVQNISNEEIAELEIKRSRIETNRSALEDKLTQGDADFDINQFARLNRTFTEQVKSIDDKLKQLKGAEVTKTYPDWATLSFDEKRASLFDTLERIDVYEHGVVVKWKNPSTTPRHMKTLKLESDKNEPVYFPLMNIRFKNNFTPRAFNTLAPDSKHKAYSSPCDIITLNKTKMSCIDWRRFLEQEWFVYSKKAIRPPPHKTYKCPNCKQQVYHRPFNELADGKLGCMDCYDKFLKSMPRDLALKMIEKRKKQRE